MTFLRQSTVVDVMLGPFVDSSDGVTTEEALTLAQADLQLSKNGGAAAQKNDATGGTHRYGGSYMVDLNATDTDTVGHLRLMCKESGALPVIIDFTVLEEAVYDAMYASGAAGPLQSTTAGRKIDVTATGAAGIDWANVENPATAVDLSATDIQLCDTITTYTGNTKQTGDSYPRIGATGSGLTSLASASALSTHDGKLDTVDANVDAVLLDTAEIGAAGAGLTALPWNVSWNAEVQSECTDALNAYDPPTKAEMDSGFTEIKGSTWSAVTDTLELIRDKGTDIETDTQDIQTQIGTAGDGLTTIATAANLATVDTVVDGIQSDLSNGTDGLGALKALIDALNDLSAAQVNAEMVDVITVDAISELAQGVPAAEPNLADAVMLLYMALRNKVDVDTTTTDTLEIHNSAGTRITQKLLTDDGTVYSEAKLTSGA